MKTNWSRFMYIFTVIYIIVISVLMLYTINIENINIGFLDKYLENKEMSLLDALMLAANLGGYKKWLLLGGALVVAMLIDNFFTIPLIYTNCTKAGKLEKNETNKKWSEMKEEKAVKKLAKKNKRLEKMGKRYE